MYKKLILSMAACSVLYAQGVSQLDEVVVVGTKTENKIFDLPSQTMLIPQETIANSGASNLSELFNGIAGLYVAPSGTTMSLRGMAHDDTMILIDGKRVNGEFSKTYELQRIPTAMIERIEIIKGSSSLLYGSDAMGGVINIITKQPQDKTTGNVQVVGGKYKKSADFSVNTSFKDTAVSLYGNIVDLDNYDEEKKYGTKIMQQGQSKSPSSLPSSGNWAKLKASLNDSDTMNYDYRRAIKVKTFGAKVKQKINETLSLNADYSYMTEDKDGLYLSSVYATNYLQSGKNIMAKNVPAQQVDDNTRKNISFGVDYNPTKDLSISYSLAYSKYEKDRKIYTTLFNELGYANKEASVSSVNDSILETTIHDLLANYTISEGNRLTGGVERRENETKSSASINGDRKYTSAFVQHEYAKFDKLSLVYGARYDKTSIDENETSLSFGAAYDLFENTKLKANISEGFRSPDDRDLYVNQLSPSGKKMLGSTVIDTASGKTTAKQLKSETSKTVELGLATQGDNWAFDFTGFKTTIEDNIQRITVGSYMTFDNIAKSEIKGFETNLSYAPNDTLFVNLSYSNIDAKNKTTDTDLTDTPESMASLALSYFVNNRLELKSITKYIGKQTSSDNDEIGGYTLTNVKVSMKDVIKNLDLFAGVDNVFGKQTHEYLGLQPKKDYYVGLNYRF